MRDLRYYETIYEYRQAVRSRFEQIFLYERDHLRSAHLDIGSPSFYGKLVDYIIDIRAPIFYTVSHPSEHFAFSGAYHFETERQRYPNVFRRNLFWLHDFTHMLFPYQHDIYNISESAFQTQFVYQERIASTETEIFAYYRMPRLRGLVFEDETLYYDVMRDRGWYNVDRHLNAETKPNAAAFLPHRNRLVTNDEYGQEELGEYPEILRFFQQWRRLTPKWVSERYKSMVGIRIPEPERPLPYHHVHTYESAIENYQWAGTQEGYEQTTLDNIRRAYAMLKWDNPPTRWRHVPDALASLEGAVFFQ